MFRRIRYQALCDARNHCQGPTAMWGFPDCMVFQKVGPDSGMDLAPILKQGETVPDLDERSTRNMEERQEGNRRVPRFTRTVLAS